uniref:Uncharacterized protein n=1 Tax=Chlamydomonas euryale TaxID=1486919 RepID=A0A7R9V6J7_9CHLO|mmetsp:Transcript_21437/g.64344  ORF Transcript_21437/g.64344 Transcript_21437/m.64344 type:complete len:283 (+) Transcript_21437:113-961(+)
MSATRAVFTEGRPVLGRHGRACALTSLPATSGVQAAIPLWAPCAPDRAGLAMRPCAGLQTPRPQQGRTGRCSLSVCCGASSSSSGSSAGAGGQPASYASLSVAASPGSNTAPGAHSGASGASCWVASALAVVATAAVSFAIVARRRGAPAADALVPARGSQQDCAEGTSPEDCVAQQRALARTRMSAHISRAVDMSRRGENIQAHQELLLALSENDLCRSPIVEGAHSGEEMADLYRLHIRYSDVAPTFGNLLQLQSMLGLNQQEGQAIEAQLRSAAKDFCI